jgi:hypothetical protein
LPCPPPALPVFSLCSISSIRRMMAIILRSSRDRLRGWSRRLSFLLLIPASSTFCPTAPAPLLRPGQVPSSSESGVSRALRLSRTPGTELKISGIVTSGPRVSPPAALPELMHG